MSVFARPLLVLSSLCLAASSLPGCKSKEAAAPAKKETAAAVANTKPIFKEALSAVLAAKAPATPDNKPYGCSVKYGPNTPAPTTLAKVGEPAPDFELQDLEGKTHKLSDLRGKTVVLEWYNPQCPFVEYAYNKGPLKNFEQQPSDKVVWLNINSGAAGKQGTGKELNLKLAKTLGVKHPVLLDESGAVGMSYGAKTTPHMFIINDKGILVYKGALDNAPFGKVDS